ncbi:MAG: MFS transporter [Candidatus Omnitrophica bacterium]|nr:MFS transporter [Candidatus Omnitrophota bacterium]
MKNLTAIVALMSVFTLAICFVVIGAVSVELKSALGIGNGEIGTLVLTLFLTACIVQLIIGPFVDKFGHKPIAITGFIICSLSMFLLGSAASFIIALVAAFLLGIGAMCVNTVGNTLMPVVLFSGRDPARASNFGNGFFGLGLIATPLIIAAFGLKYNNALFSIGACIILFLLFSLFASYPKVSTGFKFSMAIKLLGKMPVVVAALALICYISLESTMNTWIKSLMAELFENSGNSNFLAHAGFVLSLFGICMMLGRFISSAVKNLTKIGVNVIAASSLVSMLAIILLIITKSYVLAIVAIVIVGFSFAPIFPIIVGVTFARFETNLYGSIFGIIFSIGLLGGTFVPQYVGYLAKEKTIQQSLWIAVAMAGLLFVIALLMGRLNSKRA